MYNLTLHVITRGRGLILIQVFECSSIDHLKQSLTPDPLMAPDELDCIMQAAVKRA